MMLSVVIVNWNTRELLKDCLRSVTGNCSASPMEIIVVDNGSVDGSADMAEREFPRVRVVRLDGNIGFAKGCNVGIRASGGAFVLLLNTDTVVPEGAIEGMLDHLRRHPRVGAVGPTLVYGDGRYQVGAAGNFPSLRTMFNYLFFVSSLFPGRRFSRGLFMVREPRGPEEVDWVSSAAMLLRREALEDIGLVPEEYVCYMEDVIICLRLRRKKWAVGYVPGSVVVHYTGGTTKIFWVPSTHNPWRSISTYFRREHGPFRTAVLQLFAFVGFAARAALYWVGTLFSSGSSLRGSARRSLSMLIMVLGLSWEMATGRRWRECGEDGPH